MIFRQKDVVLSSQTFFIIFNLLVDQIGEYLNEMLTSLFTLVNQLNISQFI